MTAPRLGRSLSCTIIKCWCLSLLLSCSLNVQAVPEGMQNADALASRDAPSDPALEQDAEHTLGWIESSVSLRQKIPGFVTEASQAMAAHDGALPAAYTLRLAKALSQASTLRDQLFDQALRHRSALYRVDDGITDMERLEEIIIAMSAAVTLFENHVATQEAFDSQPVLRNKLNEGYPEFGIAPDYYASSTSRAANPEYRKAMRDAIQYFSDHRGAIEQRMPYTPESVRLLYAHIVKSPILRQMPGSDVFQEIVVLPGRTITGFFDFSEHELGRLKFTTSKVVGNTMGMVRWRTGKYKDDPAMLQTMLAHLQPGDILMEKSPFTLTDKTIPGHFGHAAIYVGSIDQLRALDALDLPMVQKNLDRIASGQRVVEALRSGVQLDRLEDFMNIDDVAILRPKTLSAEDRKQAVNLALGNLGKAYDFNFDVNTTDKIVCSELVYLVYPQIDFVTQRVMGSFAVTPDDIAIRAGVEDKDPLALILFAHDGQLLLDSAHDAGGLALYNQLVKGVPGPGKSTAPEETMTVFPGFVSSR
jgi:uncharacterized protein YycO